MRMRFTSSFAIVGACIISIASCKKNDKPDKPEGPPPEPFKTEKGSPLGSPISKMIGASGGTLTSEDGKLTITVSAGTVTTNTNFSIQPITLTIPSAEGDTAYRLLPEGTTFSKPVTITFHYNAADTKGSTSDLLMGCYQTADGNWKSVPSALNKNNSTITLNTQHFSDWSITSMLELKVKKPVLTSSENTDIEIVGIWAGREDELLTPLTPDYNYNIDGYIETISNWDATEGILLVDEQTPFIATFSPYSPITHGKKSHVQVDIRGGMVINDPTLPNNMRLIGQVILIAEITLLNDVYMIGSFNGADINCSDAEAFEASGHIFINAHTTTDTSIMSYVLHIVADKPGNYPSGSLLIPGKAKASVSGEVHQRPINFVSEYIHCGPPSHMAYSSGSVTIDNWGPVGTYITGSFNGPVYPQTDPNCSPAGKGFSVTFRALRGM